jgi:hypothetical protein
MVVGVYIHVEGASRATVKVKYLGQPKRVVYRGRNIARANEIRAKYSALLGVER